jgi:hypothetical protein
MALLLITFHHRDLEIDYKKFHKAVAQYAHVKLSPRSYLLETDEVPKDIYQKLRPLISVAGDTLIIFEISNRWHGRGPTELMDWLMERS